MKIVSNEYKQNIASYGKQLDSKITYNNGTEDVTLDATQLNAITPSYEGSILKSVMKSLVIDSNVEIPLNTILNYQFGVLVDDQYEYIDYGDYVVYNVEKKEDTNSYEITCYDKMLYSMKDYEAFVNEYPITIRNYIDELATYLTLEFANKNDTFVNYDKEISNELYLKEDGGSLNYTFRDVLDELAQVTASTICINNEGKLEIRYINEEAPIPTRTSKNIVDAQGFENGYINTSGVFTPDNKTALLNQKIPVEAGKTYCFSTNSNVDNMVISMFGTNDTFLRRQKVSGTNKVVQLMANDVVYVRYAVNYNNSSAPTQAILDSLEIMGEESSDRTYPYEPYGQIEMGKNLLDITNYEKGYYDTQGNFISDNYSCMFTQMIPVEEETYCLSADWVMEKLYFVLYDENQSFISSISVTDESSQTIDNSRTQAKYMRVGYKDGIDEISDELNEEALLMFEQNTQRTIPYEPYIPPQDTETINESYFKDINVNFGEKYGPVNSVVLSRAGESDSIYEKDDESIALNGLCEIKISENQIMNFNDRDEYLDEIFTQLNGLEYYINDYSSTGITYLELCDRYNVEIGENTYSCVMFNDEVNVTQGLEENIHTDMPEDSETDYSKADKTDRKINQTYIIVDKQQGQIESLISATETITDELGNVYTKEQVNQIVDNLEEGWTRSQILKGGTNIFRNTGLWFKNPDDDPNPYEFWVGNVVREHEDKAINQNALKLQANTVYQEQQVANGSYTLSFKYKKLLPLTEVKVIVNDIEYELTEDTETEFYTGEKDASGNYITQPLEVNSQNIKVQFVSDTNNACEVYDLMVNVGSERSTYEQNQNETTTDTVNISKGITITSSDTNTVFKANSDGIRVYADNDLNNAKTYFTDKGMTTKEIVVEDKGEISGVLIQEIGNQTWFTKI